MTRLARYLSFAKVLDLHARLIHYFPEDMDELISNVSEVVDEMAIELTPAQTEPGS